MGVDPQDIFRLGEDLRENHHFVDIRHLSASLRTAIQLIVDDLSLQAWMLEMHAQNGSDVLQRSDFIVIIVNIRESFEVVMQTKHGLQLARVLTFLAAA